MAHIDVFLMVSTLVITLFIELLGRLQIISGVSKVYYYLARKLGWKKLKIACKYPKAIKNFQTELSGINSKEEFSRWAKLNRRLEKLKKEHAEAKKNLTIEAVKFQIGLSIAIYIALYGFLITWALLYRSSPTFTLPPGFLGPFEGFLSMPGSPLGTVSLVAWLFVCKRVCGWMFRCFKFSKQSSGLFGGLLGGSGLDLSAVFQATSTVLPPEAQSM
ncbi:GET complex subunit get1 [Entomophthora muscae]|uniref:GET complex subunit get1 n=1 Tax=Entomophthora muscae TaxID=34485 RepID=A0ACC2RFZ6_9FUNG|nr:GET complex subunit get1 [Entomophthora muscae]